MKLIGKIMLLTLVLPLLGTAQNEVDALRYSRTFIGGTARFMAMGGAFGSLGADFSTASTNPAGIGLYSRSEISITPALFIGRTKSDFTGIESIDTKSNFNLSNVGIVITSPRRTNESSVMKSYQFAFGMNRSNNFNNRVLMEGFNDRNSILDTYVDFADGIYFGDIEDDNNGDYAYDLNPAWYTYMIDTLPGSVDRYYGAVPPGSTLLQRKEIESWGSMNEMVFALSANFSDRVYLGASFGFPFLRYFEESYYSEIDQNNEISDFNMLRIYEKLSTHGTGFNIKFGTIVRVTDYLRVGAAIHSPTWFNNMTDEWSSTYSTSFDNGDRYSESTPFGNYDYQLETPLKVLGSISGIIANMALISAEYEFTDYSKSRFRSPGYSYFDENNTIKTIYKKAHAIRVGGEIRSGHFSVRAGGGYYTSPFSDNINEGDRFFFSGGLGYRDKAFFADLAYVQTGSKEDYYLYGSENVAVDPVQNKFSTYNLMLSFGLRF